MQMSLPVFAIIVSLPLLSNAARVSLRCSAIKARTLCKEHRPDWVADQIGGFEKGDLNCIGKLCHENGVETCCGVITALRESPFITDVLPDSEASSIRRQDKLKAFLEKFSPLSGGDQEKDEEELVDEEAERAIEREPTTPEPVEDKEDELVEEERHMEPEQQVTQALEDLEEEPIEPELTETLEHSLSLRSAPTISKLPAGCSNLKARFLCQEHRPAWVFNKIGSLGDSDLACIGSLCYYGEGNENCCKVLGALAESPIIVDKQMGDEIAKQQKMQEFLTKFPPAIAP